MRSALRSVLRTPFYSCVVAILLAIGIGANALIFTAVDVLLLRPLAVSHPEQLVRLGIVRSSTHNSYDHAYVYARVLRERAHSFSDVIASSSSEVAMAAGGQVEDITANAVSGNYFSALGLRAALGRLLTPADEDREAPTAVLSYGFWKQSFAGRDVLGTVIRLRGVPFTVAGVLQPGFIDLDLENRPDVWVPITAVKTWTGRPDTRLVPAALFLRLRPGVSRSQAAREVAALHPEMVAEEYAGQPAAPGRVEVEKNLRPVLDDAQRGISTLRAQFSQAVRAIMGGVGALFLLVCANIAGLMLARAEARRREIAIRLSLGASRADIAARVLGEALLLSIVGAAGGLLMARWCSPWLLHYLPARRPLGISLDPDLRVALVAGLMGAVAAALTSLLPAIHAFHTDLGGMLGRTAGRPSRPRLGRVLVALQVSLATMLMTGGFALVRTLDALRAQDPGFRRQNLVVMTVYPQMAGVKLDRVPRIFDEIVRRAQQLPQVEDVSLAQRPLMRGVGFKSTAGLVGHRATFAETLNVSLNGVSLDHFANMGMRIVKGRGFLPSDNRGAPRPVVVSESFARVFFPNIDPIGQFFGLGGNGTVMRADEQVVGVVNDSKYRGMREIPPPTIYSLIDDDSYFAGMVLHVRVRGAAPGAIGELTSMLRGIGPGLAPTDVATMEQEIDTSLWQERLLAALSSIFAAVAAGLSALGLFGVLAYSVSRRTRELGIRMAIGATIWRIVRMVGRDAAAAVLPGLFFGLCGYAFCSRAMTALLWGVKPADAISLAGAALGVIAVSLLAAFIPAARAAAIQPADALREE